MRRRAREREGIQQSCWMHRECTFDAPRMHHAVADCQPYKYSQEYRINTHRNTVTQEYRIYNMHFFPFIFKISVVDKGKRNFHLFKVVLRSASEINLRSQSATCARGPQLALAVRNLRSQSEIYNTCFLQKKSIPILFYNKTIFIS
jgi:hypothetical protein